MENTNKWIHSECWVACFDILGFKEIGSFENSDSYQVLNVINDYEETLEHLRKSCNWYSDGCVNYCWLSDTFVMFTSDDSALGYTIIEVAAKYFIGKCLYSRIPLRGAISVGSFTRSYDDRAFMGRAIIEAFKYAEDQDWIGLILTPTAIKKIESYGLNLIYDFISSDEIPMRKYKDERIYAYRFQNGASNMLSPLIPVLCEMKSQAGQEHKSKYEKTEKFIQKYYQRIV